MWREGLEFAESRILPAKNVELFCLGADDVPLHPDSLDKIVCFDTLHALPNPAKAVDLWVQWLRPRGKVLYRDPEISATDVLGYAAGSLRHAGRIRGVDVFSSSAR